MLSRRRPQLKQSPAPAAETLTHALLTKLLKEKYEAAMKLLKEKDERLVKEMDERLFELKELHNKVGNCACAAITWLFTS